LLLINTKPKGVRSELTLGVHEPSAIQHVSSFSEKKLCFTPQLVVP